jgi:phytoene dehydrogenase-like protein
MAPPGKHFMSVFVQYVPYKLGQQPWTPDMKAAFEKDVLDTIEMNAPGFKDLILHCQTRKSSRAAGTERFRGDWREDSPRARGRLREASD